MVEVIKLKHHLGSLNINRNIVGADPAKITPSMSLGSCNNSHSTLASVGDADLVFRVLTT